MSRKQPQEMLKSESIIALDLKQFILGFTSLIILLLLLFLIYFHVYYEEET